MSICLGDELKHYMHGFFAAILDRDDEREGPFDGCEEALLGYKDGRAAFDDAKERARIRLNRKLRDDEFIARSLKDGNSTYTPEAGEEISHTVTMVVRLAKELGRPASATFNDNPVMAYPGDSEAVVGERFYHASARWPA